MEGSLKAVALLCRTSDRTPLGAAGAAELGRRVGARVVGSAGRMRAARWDDDLHTSRGCLLEAGGQIDDALADGHVPLLLAGDCSVCLTTLPTVMRWHPDAWILWLDAHADFNSPETTPSGYLGGMCLAGACGVWETGFGAGVDPARVAMLGVRDVDGGEQVLLETSGVGRITDLVPLHGRKVFVHLDLDILAPEVMPSIVGVPGGLDFYGLYDVLAEVRDACTLLGAEVTSAHPDHADAIAEAIEPLTASAVPDG